MLRWEARAARRFDRAVVVSESERGELRRADSRLAVSVVENAVDTTALAPLAEPPRAETLLFVGTFTIGQTWTRRSISAARSSRSCDERSPKRGYCSSATNP